MALFLRFWHSRLQGSVALLSIIAWLVVPSDPIAVPARAGVSSVVWPLVPTLLAVAWPMSVTEAFRDEALTAARSHLAVRGLALAFLLLVAGVASVASIRFDVAIVWRNLLLLTGLSLLAACLLPRAAAWLPAGALPMMTWLLGTRPGGEVTGWAVLLHPAGSLAAGLSALALFLAGASTFLLVRQPPAARFTNSE